MSSATNSDSDKQQLIVELKEKCAVVEEAIAYLVTSRNLIEGNATKIKNQILSDVTNALDALRRKEIQLLRQLDVVESHHLNILQTQYAELHQLLGNLQHTLHCAELQLEIPASYISGSDMGVKMTETMVIILMMLNQEYVMQMIFMMGFSDQSLESKVNQMTIHSQFHHSGKNYRTNPHQTQDFPAPVTMFWCPVGSIGTFMAFKTGALTLNTAACPTLARPPKIRIKLQHDTPIHCY